MSMNLRYGRYTEPRSIDTGVTDGDMLDADVYKVTNTYVNVG